ncbi:MAG: ABC transporter substrate-binding protein [Myxococcota bacterium]
MPPARGWIAAALLLAVACAGPTVLRDGVAIPYEQAARADLERARERARAGQLQEAEAILTRLVRELPRSRAAPDALLELGEVRLELGDRERATVAWRRLLEGYRRSRRAPEASLRLARLYRELGRRGLARLVIRDAPVERASTGLRVALYRLRADLARAEGDYSDALLALAYARRDTTEAEDLYLLDLEAEELIRERLRGGELEVLSERLPPGPVRDHVWLERARRALLREDFAAAGEVLERLPDRLRPADDAERQRLLDRARQGVTTVVNTLGLAIPLSGTYAPFGESVLRGVTLGLRLFSEPESRYRLLIRDTAGEVERGVSAVGELARLGASAILGPMRSVVAAAAAPVAERVRVPLLTLAPAENIAPLGETVFRLGLGPADQVEALVEYGIERKGYRRFAILYPRARYGRSFEDLFWQEVERRGGEIVGVESYDPGSVDHQPEIRKLVGLHYLTDEERELIAEREKLRRRPAENAERLAELAQLDLPPYIDFDALFIPDSADQVGLILPQLRLYDVTGVEFLGTSDWNDAKLIEIAGRDASGVVFVDAFFAGSEDPVVADLVDRHRAEFGADPDLFTAQGYDTALILRSLIDPAGQLTRERLSRALLGIRSFPGASGQITIDAEGASRRTLRLLTVRRGEIRELD